MMKRDPWAVGFTSGFSREKQQMMGKNYCWAIDRTSNNHDDIQVMIIIQASCPRLVDRLLPASTSITPHIDRYPACIQCIKFMEKWSNAIRMMTRSIYVEIDPILLSLIATIHTCRFPFCQWDQSP